MPEFSEEEVTAGARAVRSAMSWESDRPERGRHIARHVLVASGAVPMGEFQVAVVELAVASKRADIAEAELERVKAALTALVGAYQYTSSEPPACVKNALVAARAVLSRPDGEAVGPQSTGVAGDSGVGGSR